MPEPSRTDREREQSEREALRELMNAEYDRRLYTHTIPQYLRERDSKDFRVTRALHDACVVLGHPDTGRGRCICRKDPVGPRVDRVRQAFALARPSTERQEPPK